MRVDKSLQRKSAGSVTPMRSGGHAAYTHCVAGIHLTLSDTQIVAEMDAYYAEYPFIWGKFLVTYSARR